MEVLRSRQTWWKRLEGRCGTALMLGPVLVVLGIVLQGLAEALIADISPSVGMVVGFLGLLAALLGPVAMVLGLLGLHPRLGEHAPRLARAGVAFVTVAAVAALSLLVVFGGALITGMELPGEGTVGLVIGRAVFQVFYGSLGLGFLLFGVAGWRSPTTSHIAGGLLAAAGVFMFLPFTENLLAWFFHVPRAPIWVSGPAGVFVLVALFAAGYSLRKSRTATV